MGKAAATRAHTGASRLSRRISVRRGQASAHVRARRRSPCVWVSSRSRAAGAGSLLIGASRLARIEPGPWWGSPALGGSGHDSDLGLVFTAAGALAVQRQARKTSSAIGRLAGPIAAPFGAGARARYSQAYHLSGTKRERVNARFTAGRGGQLGAPRRRHGFGRCRYAPRRPATMKMWKALPTRFSSTGVGSPAQVSIGRRRVAVPCAARIGLESVGAEGRRGYLAVREALDPQREPKRARLPAALDFADVAL